MLERRARRARACCGVSCRSIRLARGGADGRLAPAVANASSATGSLLPVGCLSGTLNEKLSPACTERCDASEARRLGLAAADTDDTCRDSNRLGVVSSSPPTPPASPAGRLPIPDTCVDSCCGEGAPLLRRCQAGDSSNLASCSCCQLRTGCSPPPPWTARWSGRMGMLWLEGCTPAPATTLMQVSVGDDF